MEMNVKYRLAGRRSYIRDQAPTAVEALIFRYLRGQFQQLCDPVSIIFSDILNRVCKVGLGYEKHVCGGVGFDIAKGQNSSRFCHLRRRYLAGNDPAEETISHDHLCGNIM